MQLDHLADARGALNTRIVTRQAQRRWLAVCTALLTVPMTLTAAAAVCYVNGVAGGANTGVAWTDAYTDLQSALTDVSCSEVWVAQGVYKPTASANQALSFNIGSNVAVYGGFVGNEASRGARDPVAHATILSGDIDSNDTDVHGVDADASSIVGSNSHHVVVMSGAVGNPITATTVLDGFTLTGGDDSSSSLPSEGGGAFWCKGSGAGNACSPTLAKLVFSGNKAKYGGAVSLQGYSGGVSNPTLTDVTFTGNSASFFAGAMYNNAQIGGTSSPMLTNVIFSGNSSIGAPAFGGAMIDDGGGTSSPTLTNVTFSGNSASSGAGAIMINGASGTNSPTLTNVTFSGNQATSGNGGAMYIVGSSTSSSTLTNVTFYGNSAGGGNGGAIYHSGNNGDFSLTLYNATISGNSASNGGAIYNAGSNSLPFLINSIVWGDSATTSGPEFAYAASAGHVSLFSSIIQNGCVVNDCGGGGVGDVNLTGDPVLGPLQNSGGFTQTMMPGAASAAIDALPCNDSHVVPVTDQRGAVRPDSASSGATRCDIGAVEANSLPGDLIFANRFGSVPWDQF